MNQTVPIIDISKVEHSSKIDFFDDDFVIFDDLNEIPLFDYPSRIADAAVFAICQKGSVRISINLKEYTIVPNNLVVLLPDQIVQHYERSDDFAGIFLGVSKQFIDDTIPGMKNLLSAFFYVRDHPCTTLTEEELDYLSEYHPMLWKRVKMKEHVYRKEVIQSLLLSDSTTSAISSANTNRLMKVKGLAKKSCSDCLCKRYWKTTSRKGVLPFMPTNFVSQPNTFHSYPKKSADSLPETGLTNM